MKQNQTDLFVIGTIYTSFLPLVKVEAMFISQGIVQQVGSKNEIIAKQNLVVNEVDLQSINNSEEYVEFEYETYKIIKLNKKQMAMPGIIDSHVHPQSGGIQLTRLTIQKYCSWEDAKEAIKSSIQRGDHDNKEWVFAYGYSQGWFKKIPQVIQELDEACPNKPIVIMRDDCHAYWCNSKILEITKTTHENGIFIEEHMNIVKKYIPKLSEEEQQLCLLKGLQHLTSFGIVAFQDAAVKERLFQNYIQLYQKNDQLPYCHMSLCWNDLFLEQTQNIDEEMKFESVVEKIQLIQALNIDKLYCRSVKLFIDGVVESKTALMNAQYCNCGHHGQLMIPNVPQIIEGLNDRGIQAHIHSIGDRATDIVVESYEAISNLQPTMNYLAHLQFMSPKAIELFKKFKIGANFSPLWFYESPRLSLVPSLLPEGHADNMYPIRELEQNVIGFGSDWPVSSPNPFYGIEVAVTRQPLGHSQGYVPIGNLNSRVSVEQAMHYYTEGSAQLIQKKGLGVISNQGIANFIIISQNVFDIKPYQIHETEVLQTYIKGIKVYEKQ